MQSDEGIERSDRPRASGGAASVGTDIVVRLRLEGSELCVEAADIIEHLREALGFANTALMTIKGTLETVHDEEGVPFRITDEPPSTPR